MKFLILQERQNLLSSFKRMKKLRILSALLISLSLVFSLAACSGSERSSTDKRSSTAIRSATNDITSIQAGKGITDFSSITLADLKASDKDVEFKSGALSPESPGNLIGVVKLTDNQIVLQTRTFNNICYFVELNASAQYKYGTEKVSKKQACPTSTSSFDANQKLGWAQ